MTIITCPFIFSPLIKSYGKIALIPLYVRQAVCSRDFRAFCRECVEGMAWNLVCRCILISPRNGSILVMVCWFFYCWCNFYLVKRVKYGDFGLFMENIWKDWPADPDHLQKWLDFVHGLLILLILAQFWLSNTGKILEFRVFSEERMEGMTWKGEQGHISGAFC